MPGSNGPSGAGGAAPTPPSQPPPSVSPWQAPQPSYDPHSNRRGRGDKLPDAQTLGRYFRRATRPDLPEGPIPAVWQRGAHLMAGVTSAVVGVFMVFYMDFGNRDHCFMPVSMRARGRSNGVASLTACVWLRSFPTLRVLSCENGQGQKITTSACGHEQRRKTGSKRRDSRAKNLSGWWAKRSWKRPHLTIRREERRLHMTMCRQRRLSSSEIRGTHRRRRHHRRRQLPRARLQSQNKSRGRFGRDGAPSSH